MPWYAWLMAATLVSNSIASVLLIGKPRQPTTAGAVVAVLVVNSLLVWGIVSLAGAA